MIFIKNRKFSNKIDVTTKTVGANIVSTMPINLNQNSVNEEHEVPSQERATHTEVKDNKTKCQTNFPTNSSATSCSDFILDETNSMDVQEVVKIFAVYIQIIYFNSIWKSSRAYSRKKLF